ncbi:PP2C family protein-serine/threonine phosphatase [Ferrimonas pelagia]|uniref:PPM-type phosphatase domain-containing protein n=1 Tax=Ferrimonas pelagia TaxID=1177826 RepID=A0ABP9FGD2_9GAMM
MNHDVITEQIKQWLMRPVPSGGYNNVAEFDCSLASDLGLKRSENQDRVALLKAKVSASKYFVVGVLCDGMGGMTNGADCASTAMSVFLSSCIKHRGQHAKERLLISAESANKEVHKLYGGNGGCTLSAFVIDSELNFFAVNVGDSRIYVERSGALNQITTDDTIAGQLNRDDNELGGKLLQYVGMGEDMEPHVFETESFLGANKLLISSDGAHYIHQETLEQIIVHKADSDTLARRLISLSKWCGGHDNTSVMVISDLSKIAGASVNLPSGAIEVSDHISDMRVLGIPMVKHNVFNKNDNANKDLDKLGDSADENDEVADEKTEITEEECKSEKSAKGRTSSRKNKKEKPAEKPQLRMDSGREHTLITIHPKNTFAL